MQDIGRVSGLGNYAMSQKTYLDRVFRLVENEPGRLVFHARLLTLATDADREIAELKTDASDGASTIDQLYLQLAEKDRQIAALQADLAACAESHTRP